MEMLNIIVPKKQLEPFLVPSNNTRDLDIMLKVSYMINAPRIDKQGEQQYPNSPCSFQISKMSHSKYFSPQAHDTVSSHILNAHNFQIRGSNPGAVAYLVLTSNLKVQSSQGLGPFPRLNFLTSDSYVFIPDIRTGLSADLLITVSLFFEDRP